MTSGKTAVHSDMIMWNMNDTTENAAMQFASIIYGVPQVSVKLNQLPEDHLKMIKHYLGFWRENREVLLDGKLTASEPWANYSTARSTLGDKEIISTYADGLVELKTKWSAVVNCTAKDALIIKGGNGRGYSVVDCMGNKLAEGVIDADLYEVAVPLTGILTAE